jgi:MFS family permease
VAATLPNAYWLIGVYAVGGAINGALNVNAGVLLGRRVPPEVRGQAFANFNAVVNGAAGLGLLAGGVLASTFSPRPLVGLVGLAGIAVTLLFTPPLIAAATRERAASTTPEPTPATA